MLEPGTVGRAARGLVVLATLTLGGAPSTARAEDPPKAADSLISPADTKVGPSQEEMERARHAYSDGEAAYRLNHFDEAAKQYEEAYRIMKLPTMLYDVAQAWRRQFEVDKNVDHARRSVELYRGFIRDAPLAKQRASAEKFIPLLEAQIAADSKQPKGHDLFAKGQLAFEFGRYADAIAAFEASYALDRSNPTLWQIGLSCVREYGIRRDPALLRRAHDVFANFGEHSASAEDKAKAAEQQLAITKLLDGAQPPAAQPAAPPPPASAPEPSVAAPVVAPASPRPIAAVAPAAALKAPEPAAATPVYKKWWLWTIVGVVVVGAGVGVGVAFALPNDAQLPTSESAMTVSF